MINSIEDGATWRLLGDKPTHKYDEVGFKKAWKGTFRSPYVFANFVYVIYAALILIIDYHQHIWSHTLINKFYVAAAVVHVVNAFMYIWVWKTEGYPICHKIIIPEFLNVIEASLYMCTALMYSHEHFDGGEQNAATDPVLRDVQRIEMVASSVELLAAIGWGTTWYITYPRIPGRGWTLDDPDLWASASIITPGVMYIVYNVQLQLHPHRYGGYFLYVIADKIYMANSLLYFLCSLRDVGWFWFLPTAGAWPNFRTGKSINSLV